MSGGQGKHRSCDTGTVEAGQGSVKMDALSGSTYKSLGRFENIEIRAEL